MSVKKRRSYDLMLGIFVALGLLVLILTVFLIGRERRIFDSAVTLKAHFPNVAGLALGADVMLSGVVVGHVRKINFPPIAAEGAHEQSPFGRDVTILMDVAKSSLDWIRLDSIARIDSKGLLGDKLINISIGSAEQARIEPGAMLNSAPPVDLNQAFGQAQKILEKITETASDASNMLKAFTNKGGDLALANSAKSLENILKEIESGQGLMHELVFDRGAGGDTKQAIASLKQALADTEAIISTIRRGKGLAHDLIYASNADKNLFNSLNIAAADLASITTDIKSGKGTVGLLLKDPSLYNEIYGLVGNLHRNRILKAIIRYGISQQDKSSKP